MIKIVKIDSTDSPLFAEAVILFDEYRKFYQQISDVNLAKEFLLSRVERDESDIFVAVLKDGCAVGFMQLYRSFSSIGLNKIYILNDLYVDENYRKIGVAKLLLEAAKKFAIEKKAAKLTLSTAKTNIPAQSLYELEGYLKDDEFFCYSLVVG